MARKESAHRPTGTKSKAARATRKTIKKNVRKGQYDGTPGPGRPKGSTLDPVWRLTPRQMEIAERLLEAEAENGFFPVSMTELARSVDADPKYVRNLFKRENFRNYLDHILKENNIVLEMQFWRGMAIGLQAGDPKVLTLYARMTGKIHKETSNKLQVEIIAPDGTRLALPEYTSDEDIVDAEVIEEED